MPKRDGFINRAARPDFSDLKEWCLWMRGKGELYEHEELLLKAIEDTISQVGTWKAKWERLKLERASCCMMMEEALARVVMETKHGPLLTDGAIVQARSALSGTERADGK